MTRQERIDAVADYGFTERQARFLVLVMRHAGLCVKRQYAAFAGIANGGEKCNAFFDKLVSRGFAALVRGPGWALTPQGPTEPSGTASTAALTTARDSMRCIVALLESIAPFVCGFLASPRGLRAGRCQLLAEAGWRRGLAVVFAPVDGSKAVPFDVQMDIALRVVVGDDEVVGLDYEDPDSKVRRKNARRDIRRF
jgi:hypothetical protein